MQIDWRKQRVVIIGAARQGTALARYLVGQGAQVVLTDSRKSDELDSTVKSLAGLEIEWVLGGHPVSILDDATLLCPSGGVPLTIPFVLEAQARRIPLSNDSQIFMQAAPCKMIGITGSAGKTTTTTLVGRMAQAAVEQKLSDYQQVYIGGNIGRPLIAEIGSITAADLAVIEFSSFQLELMDQPPHVAALLNITPNHLDRHKTMAAYTAAKQNIFKNQQPGDFAVLGREDAGAFALAAALDEQQLLSFGLGALSAGQFGTFVQDDAIWLHLPGQTVAQEILPLSEIALRGTHNVLNVLAACTIAAAAGLPPQAMRAGVQGFSGVAHRLEFVRNWGGADWYNDSIATAPERAIAALHAFDEPLVLLAGGRDKDLPWGEFGALVAERVNHLVLFGEAASIIQTALPSEANCTLDICAGLAQAVQTASQRVSPGDVVLLSPGGTSFDEFVDFAVRGERFKQLVSAL